MHETKYMTKEDEQKIYVKFSLVTAPDICLNYRVHVFSS